MAFLGKNRDNDMTSGVIWKQLINFAVPMMIGLLFQQLYNTVDTIVVGKFVSTEALAAVSCNGNIINVLVGVFAGLATGASVVISQSYGSHDDVRLEKAVHTTMALTFILCLAGTAIGMLTAYPLLMLTKPDPDVVDGALLYLRIYFAGLSGLMIYNIGSGILRAVGDSIRPVIFLIVSAVSNTVLDIVFVVVFKMGVAGVAWATIAAEMISAVMVLYTLMTSKANYSFHIRKLAIDGASLKEILRLGVPSAVQSGLTSFSNVFVQGYINVFKKAGMAAWGVYNKMDSFIILPMQSLSMASTTCVGQNWGANKPERAKTSVSSAMKMSLLTTAALGALLMIFVNPLLRLFTNDPEVMDFGRYFVLVITPFYTLCCFNNIYAGALRGVGVATAPTVVMLFSFVVFRQLYLFILCRLCGLAESRLVISLAYPMGWIMCSILQSICYRRSRLFATGVVKEGI